MDTIPCPDRMQRVRRRIREHAASRVSQWREESPAPAASLTQNLGRGWRGPQLAWIMKMRLVNVMIMTFVTMAMLLNGDMGKVR